MDNTSVINVLLNKEFIINLIKQDLKHHQLVLYLRDGGFYTDMHHLQIMEIVAALMKIPVGKSDDWASIYLKYMDRTIEFEIEEDIKSLQPLAQECYQELLACCTTRKK